MTIFTDGKASLDMTTHPNYTANIAEKMPRSSGADLVFKAPPHSKEAWGLPTYRPSLTTLWKWKL